MELRLKESCHSGFALVTVLFITAIGLLFGVGALMLYKHQCCLRIDRQHELEKIYAVRSALNWIGKIADSSFDINQGIIFGYQTGSGRNLNVIVRPAEQKFPIIGNPYHLDITHENNVGKLFDPQSCFENANDEPDYEYGAIGFENVGETLNHKLESVKEQKKTVYRYCLGFNSVEAKEAVIRWVNIGMIGTSGWLHEEYGRRYRFRIEKYGGGTSSGIKKDEVRLCLIRADKMHTELPAGRRRGWPLCAGERALVFMADANSEKISLAEWICDSQITNKYDCCEPHGYEDVAFIGFQIAGDCVAMFYNSLGDMASKNMLGYDFVTSTNRLSLATVKYFMKGAVIRDGDGPTEIYDGERDFSEKMKVVSTPDLRAVFEVVSHPQGGGSLLTEFKVTPAYQYDILLQHPEAGETNLLATVAQKSGKTAKGGMGGSLTSSATILTYDTHGTAHKGFRIDEKNYRENGGNK